ncbi:glycosyltransferase [Methylobacterium sp. 37f]|uniref:glycosyltransferase n=1 Tax=Methylobacterium sp. 37f TaxID=2817058 RepID=UPI001FFDE0E9|nr:glycosyltransferase [Methylobacterium sp. 37f]MCK2053685.1 glycosyltransferase [Methylobacterium sp. 37f]
MSPPAILVVAPMPAFPTSAGNRRRLLTTCLSLQRGGFAIDLATYAHEDQIYRRFGQHPPTDEAEAAGLFRHTFRIEPQGTIPLTTRARGFGIDDWCPDAVGAFVAWYGQAYPETRAILVNYVFLSRALEAAPPGMLKLIDTHDRFADRQRQYRPFRAEPNFFYTDRAGEAAGLARADIVLAIQSEEAAYFRTLTDRRVHLLPPRFLARRPFAAPTRLTRIGFLGHGNDPNLFSIRHFAAAWSADWVPGRPELVIAGEISNSLGPATSPGVIRAGYVPRLEDFYDDVDLVVAPILMGSGLKMKVAEALSFGKPVIGTALGFEGFDPVAPAHRLQTGQAVKDMVLALASDATGLAALTRACEALFAGYNKGAEQAETDLLAMLPAWDADTSGPDEPASSDPAQPATFVASSLVSMPLRHGRLACETSLRSDLRDHPDLGRLIATERAGPPGAAPYTPLRRRWFARAGAGSSGTDRGIDQGTSPETGQETSQETGLAGLHLALSPEWVRERRLPPPLRAELAAELADVAADWEAEARLVGLTGEGALLALSLPRHLAFGTHPNAAFQIGASTREITLQRVTSLNTSLGLLYTTARADLPGAPAALTFAGLEPVHAGPSKILFLHDDLIGRITILSEIASAEEPLP